MIGIFDICGLYDFEVAVGGLKVLVVFGRGLRRQAIFLNRIMFVFLAMFVIMILLLKM